MGQRTALIVGAGIGGLAAGIALRKAGWHIRIFERATNPRELGFALNLAPNAIAALRELGLAESVIAEAHVTGDVEVRTAAGRLLRRFNVAAALGHAPSVVALRPALHGTLLNMVVPEALHLSSEAVDFDTTPTSIVLSLKDGRTAAGDVLIGADGVGSIIRRLLHPQEPPPRRSGYFAIRGVAQARTLSTGMNPCSPRIYPSRREYPMSSPSDAQPTWMISFAASSAPRGRRIYASTNFMIGIQSIAGAKGQ
jgi:2-polyprenyl-6-methoxyphenol hydroxylase-like FAD-dependent oxidoreductase